MSDNQRRSLTDPEIALARSVYGNSIGYADVGVYQRKHNLFQPRDRAMAPNGNIYFPVGHPSYSDDFSTADLPSRALFIHEMGHVWQDHNGQNVAVKGIF